MPSGWTGNPDIPNAKSVVDYILRWLGIQFIPGYREANTPNRPGQAETKTESRTESKAAPKAESRLEPKPTKDGTQWKDKDGNAARTEVKLRGAGVSYLYRIPSEILRHRRR